MTVQLRGVERRDLPVLFEYQLDSESNRLAGTKPRSDESFQAVWEQILNDPSVAARVIINDALVVGSISCFKEDGFNSVGYWIAREHWGKGIATQALGLFLNEVTLRPMYATVVKTNAASIRVLEKCGFRVTGHHVGTETDRYVACELATLVLE